MSLAPESNTANINSTPSVYLLWDGVTFEELGLMQYLTQAEIVTTVGRTQSRKSKKYRRKYHGGRPKVGMASLTFTITDATIAQRLNKLLIVKRMPRITFGARVDTVAEGKGAWIGSYLIDTINWTYGMGGVTLKLDGKKKQVLGLASKVSPRTYHDKTFIQILEDVLAPHQIKLSAVTKTNLLAYTENYEKADNVHDAKLNVSSPNTESDWDFISRLSLLAGYPTMYLEDSDDDALDAALNRNPRSATVAQAMKDVSWSVLRLDRMPGFMSLRKGKTKEAGRVLLGYAPNLTKDQKKEVSSFIVNLSVKQDGYKSRPKVSSVARKGKGSAKTITITKRVNLGLSGAPTETQIKIGAGSKKKRRMTDAEWRAATIGAGNFYIKDGKELPGSDHYQNMLSHPPESVTTLPPSNKLAAIAIAHNFYPALTITLAPAIPHIQAPGEVEVIGTYVHDGVYGVEEARTTWSSGKGLSTRLVVKPISKGGGKRRSKSQTMTARKQVNLGLSGAPTKVEVKIKIGGKGLVTSVKTNRTQNKTASDKVTGDKVKK